MKFLTSALAVLTTLFTLLAARPAAAQEMDPYVSCVRCHALPLAQATAQMNGHGMGYPPSPEWACGQCHDTWFHEQNPEAPPFQPYFWPGLIGGPASVMTTICTSCHTPHLPGPSHPNDLFPYLDPTPLATAPTSILPLFDFGGAPNQDPQAGGLVCSTCHDPHAPSYPVNGSPKFLRMGAPEDLTLLCSYCHTAEATPPVYGEAIVIPSGTDSVTFGQTPDGGMTIGVKVRNAGNITSSGGGILVEWVNDFGWRMPVDMLSYPSIPHDGEVTAWLSWMPPPDWTSDSFFVFHLPPSNLNQYVPPEVVRAINVPPAPANVRVLGSNPTSIDIAWDPPMPDPWVYRFDVYRDGVKVNFSPVPGTFFADTNLAPDTPHVYTVTASRNGGFPSEQSAPVGGRTSLGTVLRVPQSYPTIQAAINAAAPGTTVLVAPGTYYEPLFVRPGITVKGQDANGCVLDHSGLPVPTISMAGIPVGSAVAGFTIRDGQVLMDEGDVLAASVLRSQRPDPAVVGAGLVAHCVFDVAGSAVRNTFGRILASVNSVYLGSWPFELPDEYSLYLINNNFPAWHDWMWFIRPSGSFSDMPAFEPPGPPLRYLMAPYSLTVDRGIDLGAQYTGTAPDVGAFEIGQPYTPKPPGNLRAVDEAGHGAVRLTWGLSFDDPVLTAEYWIYRSTDPVFPPGSELFPYAYALAGTAEFVDMVPPGVTFSYQVRAFGGFGPTGPVLSAASNTAGGGDVNTPPNAVDDQATTQEEETVLIPVLINDSDPDGDPVMVVSLTQPPNGTAALNPDGSVTYAPGEDFFGTDSFTYTVTDHLGGFTTAVVTVEVLPINDPPVAVPDAYLMPEDGLLQMPVPGVLANDTDVDSPPYLLSMVLVSGPANGSLSWFPFGGFSYQPNPNFHGVDTFAYVAADGQAASNVATVTITVTSVIEPPTAVAGADQAGLVGQVLSFSGAGSTDPDGTIVSYAWNWGDGTPDGTGPTATHAYAAAGPFTVTLTVTDDEGATGTDTLLVTVTAVNLALNKPASASSTRTKGGNYPAANAVDGSTATSWMSSKTNTAQWVRVDLGSSRSISNVKVFWPATYYARAFQVLTSTNGTTWTTRYSTTSGNGSPTNAVFGVVNARYVRVNCTTPNNASYYGVAELEVYQ